jgi:serine/threonine protein kinase
MGVAYNIAPEQAESGRAADIRSDLYSLTTILYEMLTSRLPFEGETAVDIVIKHMNDRVPSINRFRPKLPPAFDAFIQKAMAKSPAERYQTPREFIAALDRLEEVARAMPPSEREATEYPEDTSRVRNWAEQEESQQHAEHPNQTPGTSSEQADRDYVGKVIGNYRVLRQIGQTGFHRLYLAQDLLRTDYMVVVKIFASSENREEAEKYSQEIHLFNRLRHPYILSIIDAGFYEGLPYSVTDYAPGGSLWDHMLHRGHKPMPIPESLTILSQIGEALFYVHGKNIVHNDVKPENILFNARNDALLADFSISRLLAPGNRYDALFVGTLVYMAPERLIGQFSKQSDQYALGCVAYEILTGTRVFSTTTDFSSLIDKHRNEQPAPLRVLNPNVPVPVEQAVLKALAKDPNDRHSDVMAFVKALGRPKG